MEYSVSASSTAHHEAQIKAKEQVIEFGITKDHDTVAGPAELLVSAFAACCLKNVERFSSILKFEYESANIQVKGERQDRPPKIVKLTYELEIKSEDANLKLDLLHRNIQKFGTIYNTLKGTCAIVGKIKRID
jgi:uncharacterized OsmC-like protein